MATKVEFKRVQTDAEVENIDIKDGQLIYTGTGKTYMDYGTQRIPTGSGGGSVTVDTAMSDTSTNAVQNKVIKEYVDSQTVPEEVIVSDTQPTGNDWKLWIDSDEIGSQASEITNSYSESIGLGYSANYVNNKINDIDTKLHDYIITRNVDIQCRENTSVTASVPSGYKFLCWLQPASYGSIKAAYMEIYNNQTSNIWVVNADSDLRHSFHCPYLCIRDI